MQKRNILNPHHETIEMSTCLLQFLLDWSSIDFTMRAFTCDCLMRALLCGKNNASLMTCAAAVHIAVKFSPDILLKVLGK